MDDTIRRLERAHAADPNDEHTRQALHAARRRLGLCPGGTHTLGFSVDEERAAVVWRGARWDDRWTWDMESVLVARSRWDPTGQGPLNAERDVLPGLATVIERWARDGMRLGCNVNPRVTVDRDWTGLELSGTCVWGCSGPVAELLVIDPEARWGSLVPLRTRITKRWREHVDSLVRGVEAGHQPPGTRLHVVMRPALWDRPFVAGETRRASARRDPEVVIYAETGSHWCGHAAESVHPLLDLPLTVSKEFVIRVRVQGDPSTALPLMRACPGCGKRPGREHEDTDTARYPRPRRGARRGAAGDMA